MINHVDQKLIAGLTGILAAWMLLATAAVHGSELVYTQIVDQAAGFEAIVIDLPPEQNQGFSVIDVPVKINGDNILSHWTARHVLMINGGYFTPEFLPVGYCKIDGHVFCTNISKKLSGFVAFSKKGSIMLLTCSNDVSRYRTVLQSGPYVIDPG